MYIGDKMDNINRQKDLNKVFDERWKANKVDNDKIRQSRKEFNLKMYGIRDTTTRML